ncbi:MAG: polyprenyl synthetase family protein [Candidatus Riflebacteria bacterium]|nr:polyprenyl synthetase family protein [Candidatus Riflebacteria bacterium]
MNTQGENFVQSLQCISDRVDKALAEWLPLPSPQTSGRLNEAIRYSAMAGGKRIRPALCLLIAESRGVESKAALRAGCAFELIHAYSLIHDDLPAMDDDDYRRGKPTNHKVFGEATAILAGDSLLTLAFEWFAELAQYGLSAEKNIEIIKLAAKSAGYAGMVGGQMLDMTFERRETSIETLETIHRQKTGALISAPMQVGAILADYQPAERRIIEDFAAKIGLLFQIKDDLLDVEGDQRQLGKKIGRDVELGKTTFPGLLGLQGARDYAQKTLEEAHGLLQQLALPVPLLADMAEYIYSRQR